MSASTTPVTFLLRSGTLRGYRPFRLIVLSSSTRTAVSNGDSVPLGDYLALCGVVKLYSTAFESEVPSLAW